MTVSFTLRRSSLIVIATILAGWSSCAQAQGVGLPRQSNGKPVEIFAENGIEWRQKSKVYIARGNARATQGDVSVFADMLTAHYRELPDGRTDIWRIDGDGNVRIASPTQTAYGDTAVYRVDQGVLVLTGKVWLDTETDRVSARDSLEYWEKRNLLVARGNAIATRGENRLRADTLSAHLVTGQDGKSRISRIDAFDNVQISSPDEIARAEKGVYNLDTGIAVLFGGVKITRGNNQLNGELAEVDFNTGVSKLFSGPRKPVRGFVIPRDVRRLPAGPKRAERSPPS